MNLRIKDVDLERRCFCIRGAKGGNDRVVAIPLSLIPELTRQMQLARLVWERDRQDRMPVMLPHRLARKYPECQFSWSWAWLFPAHNPCRDPRSGRIVRYRMHEVNVQRAVKRARGKLGISVLPHCLRHAYASHCLDRGTNPRAIQKAMGHKSLETTMGYTHAEALSVYSPLDTLPVILPHLDNGSVISMVPNRAALEPQSPRRNSVAPFYLAAPNSLARSKSSPLGAISNTANAVSTRSPITDRMTVSRLANENFHSSCQPDGRIISRPPWRRLRGRWL